MPSLTKSPVSILTRSTVRSYSPAIPMAGKPSARATAISRLVISLLLLLLEPYVTVHACLVMAGHVAGELQGGIAGKTPDQFTALARLQQYAVRIVMLHGVPAPHIHFHHLVVDGSTLDNPVLHHHGHFFLMGLVHIGRSDIELVNQLAVILHHETHHLSFLNVEGFRLVVVVIHSHRDGASGFRSVCRFTNGSARAVSMPVAVPMGAGAKGGSRK